MRHTTERSGAYLFLPDGDAAEIRSENTLVKIVEGPIYSAVIVELPFVQHTVTLYNTAGKKFKRNFTNFVLHVFVNRG